MMDSTSTDGGIDALQRDLTLFEYGTCPDKCQSSLLYQHRKYLKEYLERRWLTLGFDEAGEPCIRAADHVGLFPFSIDGKEHLILVAPKGCEQSPELGLLNFLELLALKPGAEFADDESGWQGQSGPRRFLQLLSSQYCRLLQDLCRRDFRSYYRADEGELRGRVRGRLNLSAYARGAALGKRHKVPCRWEEFTVDNWDNRILWSAARRIKEVAALLDSEAACVLWKPFQKLLSWFGSVTEVALTPADFHRSRLGRTSRHYREALIWARFLLEGAGLPSAGGRASALVLKAPAAFEKFAEAVARGALPDRSWRCGSQESWPFLSGQQIQSRRPDILVMRSDGSCAVGDTKYKEVLERIAAPEGGGESGAPKSAQDVLPCIGEHDWNQLYVYMRMKKCPSGFFIVPVWDVNGSPAQLIEDLTFAVPPTDGKARVAVVALNLLKPLKDVKQSAAQKLRSWLVSG